MPGLRSLIARRKSTNPMNALESELSHKFPTFDMLNFENGSDDKISSNFCLNNILISNDINDLKYKLKDELCDEELSPISESQQNEDDIDMGEQIQIDEKTMLKMKQLHETVINDHIATFNKKNDITCSVKSNNSNEMNLDYPKRNGNYNNIVDVSLSDNVTNKNIKLITKENGVNINICKEINSTSQDSLSHQRHCEQSDNSGNANTLNVKKSCINISQSKTSVETIKESSDQKNEQKTMKIEPDLQCENSHYMCDINPIISSATVMLSKNISNPNSSQLKCPNCLHVYDSKSKVTFSMCQNIIKFDCTNCEWIVVRKATMSK